MKKQENTDPRMGSYNHWRVLRRKTSEHLTSCDCKDCSERRKLAIELKLPYAGVPHWAF
jgi:hypothetical protein